MFTTSSGCKNDQSWLNVEWTKCVLDSLALDARYKPQDTNLGLVFALSSVWVQMPIPCCSSLGKKILFWTPLNSKLIQRQWKIQIHFLFLEKKICIGVLKYSSLKAVKVCTCICYVQNSPNCHKFFFFLCRYGSILNALMVSSFGKLLVIPAIIWGQTHSAIYLVLAQVFVFTSNISALRGNY